MGKFYVKVETDSEKFDIDLSGSYPKIFLKSKAEKGRANSELVNKLSDILGKEVGILSGHRSSRKLLVADIKKDRIYNILGDYHE